MRCQPLTLVIVIVAPAGLLWAAAQGAETSVGPALRLAFPVVVLAQLVAVTLLARRAPEDSAAPPASDAAAQASAEAGGAQAGVGAAGAASALTADARPRTEAELAAHLASGAGGDPTAAPGSRAAACIERAVASAGAIDRTVLLDTQRRTLLDLQVARLAHEANNQLLGLRFKLGELARDAEASDVARAAQSDLDHTSAQLEEIVARLQGVGRSGGAEPERADLRTTLEQAHALARGHPDVRACRVETHLPDVGTWVALPALLGQAVVNLLLNAAEAATAEGRLELSANVCGGRVEVHVDDDGPGIDPAQHERAQQPFTTTREEHCGLGLWAARTSAAALGGGLYLGNSPLGGLRATLELPVLAGTDVAGGVDSAREGVPVEGAAG